MTWDFWTGLVIGFYIPIFIGVGLGIVRARYLIIEERNIQKARETAEQMRNRRWRVVQ